MQAKMQYARAAFMLTLVALGFYGTLKFLNARDGSAWIQCIWSVAAVFLAIIAPQFQAEAQANSDYRRHKQLLRELVRLADDHFRVLEKNAVPSFSKAAAIDAALTSFPITVLKTATEAQDLMTVRVFAGAAAADIASAMRGVLLPEGLKGTLQKYRLTAQPALDRLKAD